MREQIISQNQFWVLVNKKGNTLSVPSRFSGTDKDTREVLGTQLQNYLGQKVYPIHRLDYEVSGLILYALCPEFHKVANKIFQNHQVTKTYLAYSILSQDIKNKKGVWKTKIRRGKKRTYQSASGEMAITNFSYEGIQEIHGQVFSKWLLWPVTGKSHQLRFEMSQHHFPIVGDSLYGSTIDYWGSGIALKAITLDFSKVDEGILKDFRLPKLFSVS